MIEIPEVRILRVAGAIGSRRIDNAGFASPSTIAATGFSSRRVVAEGEDLFSLSLDAARRVLEAQSGDAASVGAVLFAGFSSSDRFPSMAVRIAGALGLPPHTPAFDLQLACSAYPSALYFAARMASDMRMRVLVVNGDVQSRLSDPADASTTPLFSDAATATLLETSASGVSRFDFLSCASSALACPPQGPISMDGFRVFQFVARDVVAFLRPFGRDVDYFVPHQANMYMVRQLAKSLDLEDRLVTCGADMANPGGCSVPLALARNACPGRVLVAGFGAGLAAAAGIVDVAENASVGLV